MYGKGDITEKWGKSGLFNKKKIYLGHLTFPTEKISNLNAYLPPYLDLLPDRLATKMKNKTLKTSKNKGYHLYKL
jgi:hypothetical protein